MSKTMPTQNIKTPMPSSDKQQPSTIKMMAGVNRWLLLFVCVELLVDEPDDVSELALRVKLPSIFLNELQMPPSPSFSLTDFSSVELRKVAFAVMFSCSLASFFVVVIVVGMASTFVNYVF